MQALSCRPMLVLRLLAAAVALAAGVSAQSQSQSQSRGELLYTTHCIACHTTQMHWRDQRLATDWNSLAAQVRRWQGVALLNWSEDDVREVARYLNDRIYRYPPPPGPAGAKRAAADGR